MRLPTGKLWVEFASVIYQGELTKCVLALHFHAMSCPYNMHVDKSIHLFIHSLAQIHIFNFHLLHNWAHLSRFMNLFS